MSSPGKCCLPWMEPFEVLKEDKKFFQEANHYYLKLSIKTEAEFTIIYQRNKTWLVLLISFRIIEVGLDFDA
ncbi:hypothetical protein HNY73_004574 [Argiope bruennichi]|uniref:Uncharacterized protein n=1 Tax=Argiope bruennichi TaxID=94029 RepID=A0A8T0FRX4_ARGBR|nr:hypothetical protein HNY73_004574 [Argiope bruennichi]